MEKQIVIAMLATLFAAGTMPALAQCPCPATPCAPCQDIHSVAGIANYQKAPTRTDYGVIKKEKNLSEFKSLINKAGLRKKLETGNYTVFAPTNDAIAKMDQCKLAELKKPENKDELVKFVLAHVATGTQSGTCLCEKKRVANLNCCEFNVTKDNCGKMLQIGTAQVIGPDLNTKNGTVHIIDKVLMYS